MSRPHPYAGKYSTAYKRLGVDLRNIHSADGNPSLIDIPESRGKTRNGCFIPAYHNVTSFITALYNTVILYSHFFRLSRYL